MKLGLTGFLMFLLLTGCTQLPEEKSVILIGVLAPLTGPVPSCGEDMIIGLELAQEVLNQTSRIVLQTLIEDTQFSPKQAVTSATKLFDSDGVNIIIGDCGSSGTLAVAPLAEERKKILFTPISFADAISDAGDFVFRFASTPKEEVPKILPFVKQLEKKKAAVVYLNNDYGKSYSKRFTQEFENRGGKVVFSEAADSSAVDFSSILLKIQQSSARLVVIPLALPQTLALLKQARDLEMDDLLFISTATAEHESLLSSVGDYAEGRLYFTSLVDTSEEHLADNPSAREFYDLFAQRYPHKVPISEIVQTYDTVILLSQAVERCGDEPVCIKDALYSYKEFIGATGNNSVNSHGDVMHGNILLKTVKDRRFVKVE